MLTHQDRRHIAELRQRAQRFRWMAEAWAKVGALAKPRGLLRDADKWERDARAIERNQA